MKRVAAAGSFMAGAGRLGHDGRLCGEEGVGIFTGDTGAWPAALSIGIGLALAGCVSPRATAPAPVARLHAPPLPAPRAAPIAPRYAAAPLSLQTRIAELGRNFPGSVGIAVRDVRNGWTISYNGQQMMPQQSVSKLWVAITALDAADRGALNLLEPVVVRRENLTVFHQPIRALIGPGGYGTTYGQLMTMALTKSDNTANDMVLRAAGGPQAVRQMIAAKGLGRISFGPGETLLQAGIAGMSWRPEYAYNDGFRVARAALSLETRQAAMNRYLADPMDGACADAIVAALARLHRGELLSAPSTRLLLDTMRSTVTGAQRLKGGLSPGWIVAHKTGTGQDLNGLTAGYNDIGVLSGPGGRTYAVAVMIGSTRAGIPTRQRLMNDVVRAVIAGDGLVANSIGAPAAP